MPMRDRDPSPEGPITTEWAGSKISIYDIDNIVRDAQARKTSIYDRSDFPHPIERLTVSAEVVQAEGEDALDLKSEIQLDRATKWHYEGLNNRFRYNLTPQNQHVDTYQKIPPFQMRNTVFPEVFRIADEETGSKFMLWLDHGKSKIFISNHASLARGEDKLEIIAPPLHSISVENQLKSLMRVTALIADFVNAFNGPHYSSSRMIKGIALNREYNVGQERRIAAVPKVIKQLGGVGLDRQQQNEPDTASWEDAHDIEKITPDKSIKLSDIGGLQQVKEKLQDVAISFKYPEIMKKWDAKRPQGVLLYGQPGTGKTMLAQALAHEIGADMWILQSSDIYEKWLGKSEERIKDIFNRARTVDKPTILFFDEFDTIVGVTDEPSPGGADNARNAVAGIFKQEMNTLAQENPNILVVAATNNLDGINPSLIRSGRFDHKIYVPMPDDDARREIIIYLMSQSIVGSETDDFKMFGDDIDVAELTVETDGFSGADIAEIFRRPKLSKAMKEARSGSKQPPITQADINRAIRDFRTSG